MQTSTANAPLTFAATPVQYGSSISHTAGSSDIVINDAGIYLVSVSVTTAIPAGTSLPASGHIRLEANGTNVGGGTAMHTFAAATEVANLAFTVPVVVTAAPTTLTVVAQETGLNYSDAAINVQKIGVEPTP